MHCVTSLAGQMRTICGWETGKTNSWECTDNMMILFHGVWV